MLTDLLSIKVLSPSKPILEVDAKSIILPSTFGYVQILPGHAAYIAEMDVGEIVIETNKQQETSRFFISGGYVEVENNKVSVLADVIEIPSEIDQNRAEASRKRALDRLSSQDSSVDVERALSALKRAEIRLLTIRSSKI
ncbi:MAG: ATP synthase F1 subunit epsilon [Oligoflexales bacterium]|nr:ATP synthase F1 subunit epsilon [Oligoflexales bacterium]